MREVRGTGIERRTGRRTGRRRGEGREGKSEFERQV